MSHWLTPSAKALLIFGLACACAPSRSTDTSANSPVPVDPVAAAPTDTLTPRSAATTPEDTNLADPVSAGREVYRAQYCGICHRLDSAGTRGLFGPSHNGAAATAGERIRDPGYTGKALTVAEYLRESIITPDAYIVPGYELSRNKMPAYKILSEAELDALVQMLLQETVKPTGGPE